MAEGGQKERNHSRKLNIKEGVMELGQKTINHSCGSGGCIKKCRSGHPIFSAKGRKRLSEGQGRLER